MATVILHHRNPITKHPSSIGLCGRFIRQFQSARPRRRRQSAFSERSLSYPAHLNKDAFYDSGSRRVRLTVFGACGGGFAPLGSAGVPPAEARLRRGDALALAISLSWACGGRFAPKRAWGLGKYMAFPASLTHRKNRKAAGGSPCASHPNVAKFIRPSDRPCRISAKRSPKDSPCGRSVP